jgi:hypothetical protein
MPVKETFRLSRNEALVGASCLLLLAVGVVRLAVPDRSRMRALSLQGFDIPSERVEQGQTLERERVWEPPDDVYVVGWNPWVGAATSGGQLTLLAGGVRLFYFVQREGAANTHTVYPGGTGYLLRKGERLTLRYRLSNLGPAGETKGAGALVYFVPVQGN